MRRTRVVEVMAALSLTTDLATGAGFEKGLRLCLVADRIAAALRLDLEHRRATFHAALLLAIGCTAHAPENAAEFGDDTAFEATLKRLDIGDPVVLAQQLADFESRAGAGLAARFLAIAPTVGPVAASTGCEVSRALAPVMGASALAVAAISDVYERWDGLGIPLGLRGDQLSLEARILHVAEQLVLAQGGPVAPLDEVRRRAGGHLDPEVVAAAESLGPAVLDGLEGRDLLVEVLAREPLPHQEVESGELVAMCAVLGTVADLKSRFLVGHSRHVAGIAESAGRLAGLTDPTIDDLRCAAHLHGLGGVVVPSGDLDSDAAVLTAATLERLGLQAHWTSRILARCPSLAHLQRVVAPAGAHHAALAEGRYTGWVRSGALPPPGSDPAADLLEAAEAWAALREHRPGRPPLAPDRAAADLDRAGRDGRLDPVAVGAVLEVAGRPPAAPGAPGLTAREVDVLRLAARGLSNRDIAAQLGISDRTVGHHLAHVYDKTGHRTRAGVAVWAVERRLLP